MIGLVHGDGSFSHKLTAEVHTTPDLHCHLMAIAYTNKYFTLHLVLSGIIRSIRKCFLSASN